MGFQLPPTAPDFTKLLNTLNNSGVQKWNPPIYEILKTFITTAQQSQQYITNNATPFSLVTSPTGALNGDGTTANPLAVKVDGSTISINGSNQLVSLGAGISIFSATLSLTIAQVQSLDTVFVQIVPGIANKIIWPLAVKSTVVMSGATGYAFTTSATLVYNTTGTTAVTGAFPVAFATGAGNGTWDGLAPGITTTSFIRSGVNNAFGAGVYVKGSGPNAGTPTTTSTNITLYYVIF